MPRSSNRKVKKKKQGSILPAECESTLANQWWRLNHLYHINKEGVKTPFRLNKEQKYVYRNIWNKMCVLKCRQVGITTFFCILELDIALFNSNMRIAIIANKEDDAKEIFKDKVWFAYENLSPQLKEAMPFTDKSKFHITFANGSSIRVATSILGATLNILHLTEFGVLCTKFPDKAREVVKNSVNAVHPERGGYLFVESTAEGKEGYFGDYCTQAQKLQDSGAELTPMDFQFLFFPWYGHDEYVLDSPDTEIPEYLDKYFEEKEAQLDVALSKPQRVWYAKTIGDLGEEDMRKQFPTTPEEAFMAAIHGTYYTQLITQARKEGRITEISYDRDYPVDTWWDLGLYDSQVIWFVQLIGNTPHIIDYYENSGEDTLFYLRVLQQKPYIYGTHYAPHDIEKRDSFTATPLIELAAKIGLKFHTVPRSNLASGIELVRRLIPRCLFDKTKCAVGIEHLEKYRKQWNATYGCYTSLPAKTKDSHGADAFRTGAVALHLGMGAPKFDTDLTQQQADAMYERYAPPNARVA